MTDRTPTPPPQSNAQRAREVAQRVVDRFFDGEQPAIVEWITCHVALMLDAADARGAAQWQQLIAAKDRLLVAYRLNDSKRAGKAIDDINALAEGGGEMGAGHQALPIWQAATKVWLSEKAQQEDSTPIRNKLVVVDVVLATNYAALEARLEDAIDARDGWKAKCEMVEAQVEALKTKLVEAEVEIESKREALTACERELQEAITELKEARRLLERVSTEFAASDEMDKVRGALLVEVRTCLDRAMPKEAV